MSSVTAPAQRRSRPPPRSSTAPEDLDLTGQDLATVERMRQGSRVLGASVVGLGVAVLVGWTLDIGLLRSLSTRGVPMKANTALCFVLIGASIVAVGIDAASRRARLGGLACAGAASALALLTLSEYVAGWNLHIDEVLVKESAVVETSDPGRMAPSTAACLLALGVAVLVIDTRWRRVTPLLSFGVLTTAAIAALGYLYDATLLYRVSELWTSMALNTAGGLAAAAGGVLFLRPERAPTVVRTGPGALVLRRAVPGAVATTVVLGKLRLDGELAGHYGAEFGVSLMVVANIFVLTIIIWSVVRSLDKMDARRAEADREVRALNRGLEDRVRERTGELAQLAQELESANHELDAFAYSVAHDLRAPLRSIDGFSQVLLEDYGASLDAKGHEHLERVRAAAQRMGTLIDDLLILSRVARADMTVDLTDLTEVATRIVAELRSSEPDRRATVEIDAGLVAEADPRLAEVVLRNLLDNAWKFTSTTPDAAIRVGAASIPGWFSVADNGVGFDLAHAERLFTAFQRFHTTTAFPGTGVGLAIVRRILSRHGGDIRAEAALGEGATFTFTFGSTPDRTTPRSHNER